MEYPHTKTVKSIPRLFEEIRKVTVPSKVTVTYLKSIGFTSSNDSYLVGLLKGIDFINGTGVPTERWKQYRGADPRKAMADAVRVGYASLFATYPDAHRRDDEAIANLVRHNTAYGADTIGRVVGSFKSLCALADLDADEPPSGPPEPSQGGNSTGTSPAGAAGVTYQPPPNGAPVINLNIQLELPASADEKFYDAFFSAMKKHLMP